MQMNRTGAWLIGFFLIAGLAMFLIPLALGADLMLVGILASVGGIWAIVAVGLLFYSQRQKKKAVHQDWVFQNGIKGRATVLDTSSNAEVNEMPVMKLKLRLEVPGHPDREVKKREIMPVFAAHRMQSGLVLPVHVNPQDPDDYVLVW